MVLVLQSWTLLVGLLSLGCRSSPLDDGAGYSVADTSDFDIPEGASVIVDFVTEVRGRKARSVCKSIARGRRCMNVSKRAPILKSR